MKNFLNQIDNKKGYEIFKMKKNDLKLLRTIVENHWIKQIKKTYPDLSDIFVQGRIFNYHKYAKQIDHSKIWTKSCRTLAAKNLSEIKKLSFFLTFKRYFKKIKFSDEEKNGYGIINWRIVRPNCKKDLGPLHSDKWFWDIDKSKKRNYKIPIGMRKVRCWISLWSHKKYGFKLVPYSQNKIFNYKVEHRHGRNKPVFNEKKFNIKPISIDSTPGNLIMFNDNLIHGGCLNNSKQTRVSMEFTLFVNQ